MHGFHVNGFPNCFVVSLVQSGFTANFPHMLNEQAKHLAYIVDHAVRHDIDRIEVSADAEAKWVDTIISLSMLNDRFLESCTPGYYNNEGKVEQRQKRNTSYGAGPIAFVKVLEDWRADGTLEGLDLS